jgi:hypothetical protein
VIAPRRLITSFEGTVVSFAIQEVAYSYRWPEPEPFSLARHLPRRLKKTRQKLDEFRRVMPRERQRYLLARRRDISLRRLPDVEIKGVFL